MFAAIGAAEHSGTSNREHRSWPPAAGKDTVHVDHIVVDVLAVAQILPMLAAVGRADRAADFDRAVEAIGLAGAGIEHQNALRRVGAGCGRDLGKAHADRQTRPMLAGIIAAINIAILAPDQDHIGVMRMKQDRPYRQAMVRQLDLLPVLAAIGAAIGAILRAGIDDLRLRRMHRESAHGGPLRQAVLQRFPLVSVIGETEKSGMHDATGACFAGQTEVHIGSLICHVAPASFRWLSPYDRSVVPYSSP